MKKVFKAIYLCMIVVLFYAVSTNIHAETVNAVFNGKIDEHSANQIIQIFNNLQEDDRLNLTLTSPGGEVDAGYRIIDAMQHAKTHDIHIYVPKMAASMAALWLCYVDDVQIKADAKVLYHPISQWGSGGWLYDLQDRMQMSKDEQIMWNEYKLSLQRCPVTTLEIYKIENLDGQIWLNGTQVSHRDVHFHVY